MIGNGEVNKPAYNLIGSTQRKVQKTKEISKKKEIEDNFVPKEVEPEKKAPDVFTADPEINAFSDLKISDKLKQILDENKFSKLTNIQRMAIPAILTNPNVVLKSETGSGKTLAYLVPLIEYLSDYSLNVQKIKREEAGTMAIIFSPTRELAVQIDLELRKLLKLFYYMVSTTIMGGESTQREKARLRKGCVILICTPGRLLYHLQNTESLKLDNLRYLIFDEADRMLDLGFEREMNQCLDLIKTKCDASPGGKNKFIANEPSIRKMPEEKRLKKQKFLSKELRVNFVSATMNPQVESLGSRLMQEYVKVGFSEKEAKAETQQDELEDMVASIPQQVQQYYVDIPTQYRLVYLMAFLYAHQHEKIIVFVSNCELANFMAAVLAKYDWNQCGRRVDAEAVDMTKTVEEEHLFDGNICKLHGDMEHEDRKKNFFAFDKATPKKGDKQFGSLLICTDVASRGLDFKNITWVVQYDLSSQIKEYVNRIGRTARIASQGSALCFIMPHEAPYLKHLEKSYRITMAEKSRYRIFKDFEELFHTRQDNLKYKFRKLVNIEDKDEQQESLHAIRERLTSTMLDETTSLKQMGQVARSSSTRAYAGHSTEMRHIFDIK